MASELASEKFQLSVARVAAGLGHAARKAKRAWSAGKAEKLLSEPAQVDWAGLDIKGWAKQGALSAFRMKGSGRVLFAGARDFVRPATGQDEGRIQVQLLDAGGLDIIPMTADRLLSQSNGAMAGVLYYDGRRGAAMPSLRTQKSAATLAPVRGRSLKDEVVLVVVGADEPRVVPLHVAMKALGLQWDPVASAPAHSAAAAAARTGVRTVVSPAWLAGKEGTPREVRRRMSQLRMLGLAAEAGSADTTTRAVALFLAAAAGEIAAADAVEAAIEAAQGEDEDDENGDEWQQRLAAAGTAGVAALRGALDALSAEGALAVKDEVARMRASSGLQVGPAARGTAMAAALMEIAAEEEAKREAQRGGRPPSPTSTQSPRPPQPTTREAMQPPPPPPQGQPSQPAPARPPQQPPSTPRAGTSTAGAAGAGEASALESPLSESDAAADDGRVRGIT